MTDPTANVAFPITRRKADLKFARRNAGGWGSGPAQDARKEKRALRQEVRRILRGKPAHWPTMRGWFS